MRPNDDLKIHRLFLQYLRFRRKVTGSFLLCIALFFSVCLLYQLGNMDKLLYAFFLWAFTGLCYGVYDFMNYTKRSKALQTALTNIENLADMLPAPEGDGMTEHQYRQIIDLMLEDRRNLLSHVSFRDSDMTDYYTMWAHQIKVPIAAMRLLLQNAESLAETEDAGNKAEVPLEYNRLLSRELFRIEQYVEMVLYYQRLDSINSDFLFKEYDLRDIVNQAVKKYSMFFINNRLALNLEEFSCRVVTDEKWLQFVIEQILSNALKYTSRGGISICLERTCGNELEKSRETLQLSAPETLKRNPREAATEQAILIVEDTGIGIRPEDLPRIFERGFTGYNGRLDKKSTGIGLYLGKKILEKLSHTIEVTSEAGKGTRVTIGFVLTKM